MMYFVDIGGRAPGFASTPVLFGLDSSENVNTLTIIIAIGSDLRGKRIPRTIGGASAGAEEGS